MFMVTGGRIFICSAEYEYTLYTIYTIHCDYLGWLTIMNPNTPKVKEGITHSKYSSYVFISCNISNIKHYCIIYTTRVMIQ